jgi:hypothetical protein
LINHGKFVHRSPRLGDRRSIIVRIGQSTQRDASIRRAASQTPRETARSWWHPAPGLELQIEKAHQVLALLVREIVQGLQHHDLELQDRIVRLVA